MKRDLRALRGREPDGLCNIFGIDDILITAGIGLLGDALSSGANSKANANNSAAIAANQAQNAGLVQDTQAQNTDLLTKARDYTTGIFDQAQQRNQGVIDGVATQTAQNVGNTSIANQATIDGNTQAVTSLLTGLRDQNGQLIKANTAANEATIQGYGDKSAALFQPFVTNGTTASNAINALLGLSGDASAQTAAFKNWADSTGYQFALDSGRKSVESSQAANGMLESGDTLKALQERGQQTGQTYFSNYLAALNGQASQGLSAAGSLSSVFTNTASALAANRNSGTSALVGINDTFGARQGNNINNYTTSTLANRNAELTGRTAGDNAYLSNSTGNIDSYAGGLAANETGFAKNLGALNTSATNALVIGNNSATAGQMGVNNAQAQNKTNLYGNIADGVTDAINRNSGAKDYNFLYGT